MTPTANTRSPAGKWNGEHHSESAAPDPGSAPPDKTKATAGNGGESQNIKADGLLLSSLQDGTDFTPEDRHASFVAGLEQGRAERVEIELEHQVHARLHQLSVEALGLAQRHAAETGPAWAALVAWAGESDER